MPRTQYYVAASLDGYIAKPDGDLDWLTGYQGQGSAAGARSSEGEYERFYSDVGAVAMGSKTYEFILGEASGWPYAGRPSWVFTRRELSSLDPEIRFAQGDVSRVHAAMTEAAGDRNVWLVGGGDLVSQFASLGLLDELILTVVPVVLGEGLPLFAGRIDEPLRLTAAQPFTNGMVELRYDLTPL